VKAMSTIRKRGS